MSEMIEQSYQLGQFRDNTDSLRRLKRQAGVVVELELAQLEAAGLVRGCSVLDLGCGPGIITAQIARHALPRRMVAMDSNPVSLRETWAQMEAASLDAVEVVEGNIYAMDAVTPGRFDFIYSRLVFQHLSNPLAALDNIAGCLTDGGRLCICDVDDRWFNVAPACPELTRFLDRVRRAQTMRGGDRQIGTQLPHLLARAGFTGLRTSAMLISTDLIGKDAFCDLTLGYKLEVVPEVELEAARLEVSAIREIIFREDGWAAIAVFFVSAGFEAGR